MPKPYFNYFPVEQYDIDQDGQPLAVTNIMHRFKIREMLLTEAVIFYTHNIREGERPDQVSAIYYGSVHYDWLILITNEMLDRHFGWPLHYYDFISYLKKKYGSVRNSHQTVHHYEKIIQAETEMSDGIILPERSIVIDQDTYEDTVDEARKQVSCFQYEKDLNETRRTIKVIHPSYLNQIVGEAERIFNAR